MLYHVSTISIIKEDRLKKKRINFKNLIFFSFSFHCIASHIFQFPYRLIFILTPPTPLNTPLFLVGGSSSHRIPFPLPLRLQALLSWLEWSAGQFDNWICGSGVIYVYEGPELTIGRGGGHAMHSRQTSWRRSAWRES